MHRHLHRTTSAVLSNEQQRSAGDAAINATLTEHPEDESEGKTEVETGAVLGVETGLLSSDLAAASPATLRKNEQVLNSRGVRFTAPADQEDADVVNMVRVTACQHLSLIYPLLVTACHCLALSLVRPTTLAHPSIPSAAVQHPLCG